MIPLFLHNVGGPERSRIVVENTNHPRNMTYLYQKFDFIAISRHGSTPWKVRKQYAENNRCKAPERKEQTKRTVIKHSLLSEKTAVKRSPSWGKRI
jgi:hypothetical protein